MNGEDIVGSTVVDIMIPQFIHKQRYSTSHETITNHSTVQVTLSVTNPKPSTFEEDGPTEDAASYTAICIFIQSSAKVSNKLYNIS